MGLGYSAVRGSVTSQEQSRRMRTLLLASQAALLTSSEQNGHAGKNGKKSKVEEVRRSSKCKRSDYITNFEKTEKKEIMGDSSKCHPARRALVSSRSI